MSPLPTEESNILTSRFTLSTVSVTLGPTHGPTLTQRKVVYGAITSLGTHLASTTRA